MGLPPPIITLPTDGSLVDRSFEWTTSKFLNKLKVMLAGATNQLGVDSPITPQSGFTVKSQNINFNDALEEPTVDIPSTIDETRTLNDASDADLGSFFSRPVKVFEGVWPINVNIDDSFNPWKAYFENKRVVNRITNFNLLRCTLKVKFLINGNPFFYGRLMPTYIPLANDDSLTVVNAQEDNVHLSQFPRLFIDPAISSGGEMKLPFFWYKDYMSIPNGDWDDMGKIQLTTLNRLKHVNGGDAGTDLVTLTCYAWAEDVMLAGPTYVNAQGITPQSGMDEYPEHDGVVSKPAATVAKVAGMLTTVPRIGPFALATQLAAGALANMASVFGYSRPVIVAPPTPFRPAPVGDMCTTNSADNSKKLSVDVKQELSIDPRIAGLSDVDEMSIKHIASRESYWTQFDWVQGTQPNTHLWNCRVDPCVWDRTGTTSTDAWLFPATAMASLPFRYWTGTMNYRFQIVASAMHRGRLAIQYDPVATPLVREDNVNYIEIIDIAQCREFTVSVSNNQPFTLLEHAEPSTETVDDIYNIEPLTSIASFGNGTLSVWVINDLTTPTTDPTVNNDIQINVFLSAGDDFETFVPDSTEYSKFVAIAPQSGIETTEIDSSSAQPYKGVDAVIGQQSKDHLCRNKVYTGECITSFRQMLKRYEFHNRRVSARGGDTLCKFGQNAFPFYRGAVPGAVGESLSKGPYNYCNTLLIHWVALAFQGHRGSMRWKAIPNGYFEGKYDVVNPMKITRDLFGLYNQSTVSPVSYLTISEGAYEGLAENGLTYEGTALTTWAQNPNEEFEIPFYTRYRFEGGKPINFTTDNGEYEGFTITTKVASTTSNQDGIDMYCAVGEDFTTYFFTGLPRLYRENSFPLTA